MASDGRTGGGPDTGPVAAFPGTFNPLTVAHLEIAEHAVTQAGMVRVDLVISRVAIGKEHLGAASLRRRLEALERAAAARPWLGARATDAQLLADVAEGYEAVILGADKWPQVVDPAYYGGSSRARDDAVARLPHVIVAPRPPHDVPAPGDHPAGVTVLELPPELASVSSTAVRDGARHWLAPEAVD